MHVMSTSALKASIGLISEAKCPLSIFNKQFDSLRRLLDEHIYRNFAPYENTLAQVWSEELDRIQASVADARL